MSTLPRSSGAAGAGTRHTAGLDHALRAGLGSVAQHGLVAAGHALAGDDPQAACAVFERWQAHGQPPLPRLAEPVLAALGELGVTVPGGAALSVVERFLIGVETDAPAVRGALDAVDAENLAPEPDLPPDARAALFAAAERSFALLHDAYGELAGAIRHGDRSTADDTARRYQTRLEAATQQIRERSHVLAGVRRPAPAQQGRRARRPKDRPAFTLVFVAGALLAAAVILWAVTLGWPIEPVQFDL